MKVKLYRCNLKVNLDEDLKKVTEYFKLKGIDVTFNIEPTSLKLPEWNVRANLVLPLDGKYDVVMYAYDRLEQRPGGTGYAENFSKQTSSVFIPTGVIEAPSGFHWKVICHELMHCLFFQIINRGIVVRDLMDGDYLHNDDPYHPNGNFARSWKELLPHLKVNTGYTYFSEAEVARWKLKPEMWRLLDTIRGECGFPFNITSGLRTKAENDALKDSVSNSAHLSGLASDISCLYSERRLKMVEVALKHGVNRIGIGKTFVHLDIDPTKPKNVMWHYY